MKFNKTEGELPEHAVLQETNERGYTLTAYAIRFHDNLLEFVQVDMPDGTTAYFTHDEDGMRAGPFGGGYSWAVPKYVLRATEDLLKRAFPAEVPA